MKIRTNYVSNSSSSSFVAYIDKKCFNQFKADFEKFVDAIKNIFPKYEGEYFALSFKTYTEREIVKQYIEEKEGVKYPSEDLIDFFMEKLKKKKDDPFWAVNFVEVEYEIDTECYETMGFQNLCREFIDNYNGNKG